MFSEYNFRNYNFRLLFYVLALNLVGVVVINSAVGGDRSYVNRQLIGLFGGLMLAIAISLMDYRKLMKCCGLVYIGCVGILLAVIVAGQLGGFGGGSRRWIDLPVIGRFQPSEFVKIGLIFFFSWFLQKNQEKINRPSVLVTAAVNQAVAEELERMGVTYHQMVRLTRDGTGKVTALQADTVLLNQIKSAVTEQVGERLQDLSSHDLSIPLGSLTGVKIFSGRGPSISFRLMPEGVVMTNLYHEFSQAGVNQTLHRIYLQIDMEISAVLPGFSMQTKVSTNMELGQTVIVGEVPEFFGNIGIG